jgi:tRNA threonylcarbamoyladenosine biosynthesis protein TsaE
LIHASHSVEQTEQIAAELAAQLRGGTCVALLGDLGAGKTQFVRGMLKGLGGNPRSVSSPTFVLLNVYETGRLKVYHLDAYRVAGAEDFEAIGFAELLDDPNAIVVVEWPGRIEALLPSKRVNVIIQSTGEADRTIDIQTH